ncbi:MAG: YdbH domain-containing protein [Pseudomonadota bacterium]
MTGRRTGLRAAGLLLILTLVLMLYAGQRWQTLLAQQGISQLDWQGLHLSFASAGLRRLALQQRSPSGVLHIEAEGLSVDWRRAGATLGRLHLDWQPVDAPVQQSGTPLQADTLFAVLAALPRRVQIERLSAELPCAAGRCRLVGALVLQHAGDPVLPAELTLNLHRQTQQAEVRLQLLGSQQDTQLTLQLLFDQQARATLASRLQQNAVGALWSGSIQIPSLPSEPWPTDWLAEWLAMPQQHWSAPPGGPHLKGDWHLQLPPGPLTSALLSEAEGSLQLSAHLPAPWPLPALGSLNGEPYGKPYGELRGHLSGQLNAQRGHWFVQGLRADLQFSQLQGDWLAAVPEALRPTDLALRIESGGVTADAPKTLPLRLEFSSEGPVALKTQADLTVASAPPWVVQLHSAEVQAKAPRAQLEQWDLRDVMANLQLSGRLDDSSLELVLGEGSRLRVGQASSADIRLEQLEAGLAGLQLQARFAEALLQEIHLHGPNALQIKNLQQPLLKPQGWGWTGQLDASLERTSLQGTLIGDSGLSLELQLLKPVEGPLTLEAGLQEVFLRTGNPLSKTLNDWPALLTLSNGRLRGDANLRLPRSGALQLGMSLSLQGLAGIYDRTELSGLDAQLQLLLRENRLEVKIPAMNLQQANPGVPIGPLQLQGDYSANLEAPLAGQLVLQQAQTALLGGHLRLDPVTLDLTQRPLRLPLHLQGLELEQLFAAYPAEGLAGTGTLDGRLPLVIASSGISIEQGDLAARPAGGILQFHSERIRALGRSNPAMKLVADALEDFHYRQLSSDVSYDEQGLLRLALRLEGQNPAIENGRPIHFSINLQEDIPTLLASLQLSDKVSELIKQRVQDRLRQRKKATAPEG